jgi:hypothetical protein
LPGLREGGKRPWEGNRHGRNAGFEFKPTAAVASMVRSDVNTPSVSESHRQAKAGRLRKTEDFSKLLWRSGEPAFAAGF